MDSLTIYDHVKDLIRRLPLCAEDDEAVMHLHSAKFIASKGYRRGTQGKPRRMSAEYSMLWGVLDRLKMAASKIKRDESARMIHNAIMSAIEIYDPEVEVRSL